MITKKMAAAINKQINAEMYSSNLYLSMAAQAENAGMKGTATWLEAQAKEEMGHAMKFYKYLNSQGQLVVIDAIAKPDVKFESLLQTFKAVLKHEQHVTALINGVCDVADAEKDRATQNFMQWFVNEQVEEEEHATEIVGMLEMAGNHTGSLFMIDRQLGKRAAG